MRLSLEVNPHPLLEMNVFMTRDECTYHQKTNAYVNAFVAKGKHVHRWR